MGAPTGRGCQDAPSPPPPNHLPRPEALSPGSSGAGAGERKGVVYATKGAGEKTRSGEPGGPQKYRAPRRSPPHPPWSPRERENSLKRAGTRPRVGGGRRPRAPGRPASAEGPQPSPARRLCAPAAEPLPAVPRAPAASVARLRRDGGGGVGASRAGRGGVAPPRLPRDGRALGAGNEEAAGGGSGGGAAAGTRARLPPGGLGEPPRARPLALPGPGKSSRRASLPRSWPRSSALRPPPGRSAPHAQIHLLRRTGRCIPAAGTRAGCRPTRTCCWRLPGSPAATHPHPGREGAAGKETRWSGEGTDPVPRIRAGAPRRRAP